MKVSDESLTSCKGIKTSGKSEDNSSHYRIELSRIKAWYDSLATGILQYWKPNVDIFGTLLSSGTETFASTRNI